MNKKSSNEKYVSQAVFIKEITGIHQNIGKLHQKIDSSVERLDHKIDAIALGLIRTQDRVERIESTMATKDDVRLILNRIDAASPA